MKTQWNNEFREHRNTSLEKANKSAKAQDALKSKLQNEKLNLPNAVPEQEKRQKIIDHVLEQTNAKKTARKVTSPLTVLDTQARAVFF